MKIKRILGVALMVMLTLALALSITACKNDEPDTPPEDKTIEGITFEGATVTYDGAEHEIKVSGTLPEGVTVSYTGNKGTDAGEYSATATLSGEGYKTLTLNAKFIIEAKTIEGVTLTGQTFTYDGTAKSLALSGTLPEGVTPTWQDNEATNAGSYSVKVTLKGKNYNDLTLSAVMVIEKADITGITLEGGEFTYDGEEKKLEIAGTLPEGVSVTYKDNVQTNAGEYPVTATLSGDNYNTLTLPAVLVIKKAEITGISFPGGEFTYDGEEKKLEIVGTLPEGVSVTYKDNVQTEAGVYEAVATISGDNYKELVLKAALVITQPIVGEDITGITLEDATFTYDGTAKSLSYSGTLPEGVTVTYAGNEQTAVGAHTVTAVFSGEGYKPLTLTATLTIVAADIEGVTLEDGEFTYDGTAKSLSYLGTLPEGVTVTYAGNEQINAGEYQVVAVLSGEGYNALTLNATLKINKATITGITLNDLEVNYEKGKKHSLRVEGELPEGVTVTYSNEEIEYAGTYTITVIIEGENYERIELTATLKIKGVAGSGLTTPEHKW